MIRRVLVIASLAAATVFAFAGTAQAQTYGGCTATASKTTVAPGDVVTISGTGATANGTVTASVNGTAVGSGTASASGTFSFSATIPANVSGTISVSVNCGGSAGVLGLTLTVSGTAAATTTTSGLARTGTSDTFPFAAVGIALVGVGGLVLLFSRRRRHSDIGA
jgi:LPXTG-motif cell wall-anchored protein